MINLVGVPWWLRVAVVITLARLISAVIVLVGGHAGFSYVDEASLWDGSWYRTIAEHGYPRTLPLDETGLPAQNPWAFYPVFPLLARLFMTFTGAGWNVVVTVLNPALALAAGLLLHRWLARMGLPASVALWAVAFWSVFPASPVLQFGYTEPLATVLLLLLLTCLTDRRYLTALALVWALDLTRPVGPVVVAVLMAHAASRWWNGRWPGLRPPDERPQRSEAVRLLILVVGALPAAVAWQLLAALGTGRPDAYVATQMAWHGHQRLSLFSGWGEYLQAQPFLGQVGLICALAALLMPVLFAVRLRLPPELAAWQLAMTLFLAAVQSPSTSIYRYLMSLLGTFVLLAAPIGPLRFRPVLRGGVLILFMALQVVWVAHYWTPAELTPGTPPP